MKKSNPRELLNRSLHKLTKDEFEELYDWLATKPSLQAKVFKNWLGPRYMRWLHDKYWATHVFHTSKVNAAIMCGKQYVSDEVRNSYCPATILYNGFVFNPVYG
jgi:hypothetical protein